jgi:hypothetical protein
MQADIARRRHIPDSSPSHLVTRWGLCRQVLLYIARTRTITSRRTVAWVPNMSHNCRAVGQRSSSAGPSHLRVRPPGCHLLEVHQLPAPLLGDLHVQTPSLMMSDTMSRARRRGDHPPEACRATVLLPLLHASDRQWRQAALTCRRQHQT